MIKTIPSGLLACAVLAFWLSGCVTETTSGRVAPKEQPEEAAELNVQLGVGYLRQGDLKSAQSKLERAVKLDPDNVNAHRALGLVYERLEDPRDAEKEYRHAVALEPQNPGALNSLAVFLCRDAATRDEALKYFNRAIAVPQSKFYSDKAMLNTNAGVCAKNRDLALAEEYMRRALTYDPAYPDALLQLADVALQRENYLQARAFLERYAAASSESAASLWLSFQVESALGDVAAANKFARQLQDDFPTSIETRRLIEYRRNAG